MGSLQVARNQGFRSTLLPRDMRAQVLDSPYQAIYEAVEFHVYRLIN
jgi:hypothetical protein